MVVTYKIRKIAYKTKNQLDTTHRAEPKNT